MRSGIGDPDPLKRASICRLPTAVMSAAICRTIRWRLEMSTAQKTAAAVPPSAPESLMYLNGGDLTRLTKPRYRACLRRRSVG
jgi:hypothetical protein